MFLGHLVAPVAEGSLGELHDVALVDQGHRLTPVGDGVLNGALDEAHAARIAHRLNTNAHLNVGRETLITRHLPEVRRRLGGAETNLGKLFGKFLGDEVQDFLGFRSPRRVFDTGVNVFGVLAEDDHVHLLRSLNRARHAGKILHRTQTHIQVEHLAQRHIQRADASTHRGRQRTLNAHQELTESLDGVVRQPVVEALEALLSGEDFHPGNLALATIGLGHGRIHHPHRGGPDIRAGTVTPDKGNNGLVGNVELAVLDADLAAVRDGTGGVSHVGCSFSKKFTAVGLPRQTRI